MSEVRTLTRAEILREYGDRATRPIVTPGKRPSFVPIRRMGRALVPSERRVEWPPLHFAGIWRVKRIEGGVPFVFSQRYRTEEDAEKARALCEELAGEGCTYEVYSSHKGNPTGRNGKRR